MRKVAAFLYRVRGALHATAVAVDQLAFVLLAIPYYVFIGGEEPSARETISSRVGREARNGWLWARYARWEIDKLFTLVGSPMGHCERAILHAAVIRGTIDPPAA